MNHICPACGHEWSCVCTDAVKLEHERVFGVHPREIACSLKCAHQLAALVEFLQRYLR
jgi:hypothetical protein